MRRMITARLLVLGIPFAAMALPLSSADVAKLVQDSPPLEEYKGEHAVVWRRSILYSQDKDGRAVRQTSVVVLCDAAARLEWLTDLLYAPNGGRIELEQAAIFDPGTSKLLKDLAYSKTEAEKQGRIVLEVPRMDDVYLFVLSFRQYFPEKDVLEDIAWIGAEYPVWEGSIQVRLAKDKELLYQSSSNSEPTKREDANFRWYGWFYFKQPANRGVVGMLDSSDPYVIFSLRRGTDAAVGMMRDLASRKWGDIPAKYVVTSGSVREQALQTIEKFWRSDSRLPVRGVWRSASMIPSGGPWTTWEAAYLIAGWLEKQGWKAQVWFQNVIPMDKKSLAAASTLIRPVLYLVQPQGGRGWYYVPGQATEEERIPVTLRGKTLYNGDNGKLQKRSIDATRLTKNRLSIAWKLSIAPDGMVDGTLDLRVRHSWVDMFESLSDGRKDQLYALLPGLRGWIDESAQPEVKPLGDQGFKIVLAVHARSGIEGAQGLLAGLPSIYPEPMLTLNTITDRSTLKFPFVIEQTYNVQLPSGYRALTVPSKASQSSAVSEYTSTYRINSRRNILEGEEKLLVSGTKVEAEFIEGFKRVLAAWGYWRNSNLALMPVRSKSK